MKESAGVLQQAKFIALVLKLILVSVIYETRNVFVFNDLKGARSADTDEFARRDAWFRLFTVVFWVVGAVEFLFIFKAATIFNNQANLLQIFVHLFGIVMLLNFKQNAESGTADWFWCLIFAG